MKPGPLPGISVTMEAHRISTTVEVPLPHLNCFLSLTLLLTLACGGGSDSTPFVVEPQTPVVSAGERLQIAAQPTVDLGGEVEWEVQELYGGGLLKTQGPTVTYVAPDAAGTYHLTLRSHKLDGHSLKQTVTVQVVATSAIDPAHARVAPGAGIDFTVRMKGLTNGAMRWSIREPDGGTITETGHYTAPGRAGTFHLKATSVEDPSLTAQATVNVE